MFWWWLHLGGTNELKIVIIHIKYRALWEGNGRTILVVVAFNADFAHQKEQKEKQFFALKIYSTKTCFYLNCKSMRTNFLV